MFRPYFVVIIDSFREAIASRVLWILLSLVTGLLIGLGLIGYREKLTTRLVTGDINDWGSLVIQLAAAEDASSVPGVRRIVRRCVLRPRARGLSKLRSGLRRVLWRWDLR